jgi:hypothetical protein
MRRYCSTAHPPSHGFGVAGGPWLQHGIATSADYYLPCSTMQVPERAQDRKVILAQFVLTFLPFGVIIENTG